MKLTREQQINGIVKLAAVHRNAKVAAARSEAVLLVLKVSDNRLTDADVVNLTTLLNTYAPKEADQYVRPSIVRQKLFARELAHVQRQPEVETPEVSTTTKTYKVSYAATLNPSPQSRDIAFEARDLDEAKKQTIRKARQAGLVDKDDTFKPEWRDYSAKGFLLRPLALGSRGYAGGLCLWIA